MPRKESSSVNSGEGILGTGRIMPTVLLVDGDKPFRQQLHTLFNPSSGFDTCVEARNGAEALAEAKRRSPNLAVLSFSLPDVSGLDLAEKLRAVNPGLPVFILTTDYGVKIEKRALSSGITAVFSKLDDLATVVANARAVCGIE